jgi:thioredoxin
MVQMCETKAEFDAIVAGDKLVVVDFTATWCGPCQNIAPTFAAMAEEFTDAQFIKVDVDANEETAAACEIACMPTFQFWRGGKKIDQFEGADANTLRARVTKHLG